MSNYTKATNFAAKDTLPSGNSGKIVKGTEIDTEFNAIASAVSSKADTNSPTLTGTPAAPTAAAGTNTTQVATTAFVGTAVTNERTATGTLTNKTINGSSNTITNVSLTTGVTGTLPVANGGSGVTTSTGTGSVVLSASPTFTGTPLAPTAAAATNTTQIATTAHVFAERSNTATLTNKTIDGASNTITNVNLASGVTGTLPVANGGTGVTTSTGTGNNVLSASPALTGTPTAPTAAAGTNTTQVATTAHVFAERTNTATLTNKTISADDNTISGIAASSFVLSNSSGNIDGTVAQKAIPSGVVVGTTDTQTLTNKTISGADNTINNINGANISTGNIAAARITNALNATGSAPIYACRAWVNFDGTGTTGTNQTIRASGNVTSVYKNGTGDYTITFTTAMPDENYSANANCQDAANGTQNLHIYGSSATAGSTYSTTELRVASGYDSAICCVQVFR